MLPVGPSFFLSEFIMLLQLALSAVLLTADAYSSAGFLQFPDAVELAAVSAVGVDGDGNVYVLHRGEPPLVVFDVSGRYLRGFGQGLFKVPHGLRVLSDGQLWTTDNGNHVLRKFTPTGRLIQTLGAEGKAGGGQTGFRAPDDVVVDSQGNLFVADSGNGRIVKFNSDGVYLSEWGKKGKESGQFATAHGLAIDKQDRIYVADRGNKRVQVFDSTGKHMADFDGFGNPFGLLVVGNELLATEGDIHKIFHLDLASGQVVKSWGDPKTLLLPHFMAVDSQGTLYVCEVNGKRVQKFRPAGP